MAGVFFVVCVPTANYEHTLIYGSPVKSDENNENLVKLDVELRNKNSVRHIVSKMEQHYKKFGTQGVQGKYAKDEEKEYVPMEKILDELLTKLQVEHIVWCGDKLGNYYEVMFPLPAGDPCENCLHCLTELGIGKTLNSVVSVLPCNVVFNSMKEKKYEEEELSPEDKSSWTNFVDSVKSKLTVKQVVDGVQSGGNLTFDYIMLVLTADCLAALGLVENNASNIVAAMLVSPLMGPVMSVTFGTIISDRNLQCSGFKSLFLGIFISIVFGFIFGLILGSTEMPWGSGDWPTEEMKGRGNARCLWMGVLWALPSGTGVALALLQGAAGPLIGVAISASLLPPVVNCGLYWALACIWLLHEGNIEIPHIKNEAYGNSSYVYIYHDYLPIEFLINGIISALLTIVNVICIFITAIILLKIKEVAAPYTSTPDVRRFWEKDIRIARENNKSVRSGSKIMRMHHDGHEMTSNNEDLDNALEVALRQAVDDETFRRVKRISYANQASEDVPQNLLNSSPYGSQLHITPSALHELNSLERQISSLLASMPSGSTPPLSRLHTLTKSFRHGSMRHRRSTNLGLPTIPERSLGRNNVTRTTSLDNTKNRNERFMKGLSMTSKDMKPSNDDERKTLIKEA